MNRFKTTLACGSLLLALALPVQAQQAADNTKGNVEKQAWTEAFAEQKADSFASAMAEDIVLEAATLMKPVQGVEHVKVVMEAASSYYVYCNFTSQATQGNKTYLEWEVLTHSGLKMNGVTVLTKNDKGQLAHVSIHHRPLHQAIIFSREMGKRVEGKVPIDHFY